MSEITSHKKDRDVKLWDAAVEYCNENHKGDDRKYAACHKTFLDAITSEAAREYWEGQGWVRVEDGLPEEFDKYSRSKTVLVFESGEIRYGWLYQESKNWGVDGRLGNINVTHWRPLPAPPTQ